MKWSVEMMAPLFYTGLHGVKRYISDKGNSSKSCKRSLVELALQDTLVTHILFVDSDNVSNTPKIQTLH